MLRGVDPNVVVSAPGLFSRPLEMCIKPQLLVALIRSVLVDVLVVLVGLSSIVSLCTMIVCLLFLSLRWLFFGHPKVFERLCFHFRRGLSWHG